MAPRFKICFICVTVSGLWLSMSALVAWGIAPIASLQIPVALLMGATVTGISYQRPSRGWKIVVLATGMPVAYLFVTHLTKSVVIIEIIALLIIAYLLFVKKNGGDNLRTRTLEEQMKHCC